MIAVNFSKPILDYDNVPVSVPVPGRPEETKLLTLDAVCVNALMVEDQQKPLTGEEKLTRHSLAIRFHNSKTPTTLSAEDVVLLKSCVAKAYNTMVYGRVVEMLETAPAVDLPLTAG